MPDDTEEAALRRCETRIVQIGLLLVILLLLPKSIPHEEKQHSVAELRHDPTGGVDLKAAAHQFAVVFDAGSTGSRVHVFKFEKTDNGGLKLISDTFEQLKPGLSAFPDDPEAAAASLKPLIETALKTVPKDQQVK